MYAIATEKAKKVAEIIAKELKEERFEKGTDIGKKGAGFAKIAKAASKEYGSEEAGKRVAGAILKKVLKNK
jgi:flavodoxin